MASLEQIIRQQIGNEGPQLPSDEYEARIENELDHITPREMLERISRALEENPGALIWEAGLS